MKVLSCTAWIKAILICQCYLKHVKRLSKAICGLCICGKYRNPNLSSVLQWKQKSWKWRLRNIWLKYNLCYLHIQKIFLILIISLCMKIYTEQISWKAWLLKKIIDTRMSNNTVRNEPILKNAIVFNPLTTGLIQSKEMGS